MNRFPKEAPMWQAMDTDYNKRIDEADAPLFVQPSELGSAELIDGDVLSPMIAPMDPAINKSNFMPPAIEEADDQNQLQDLDTSGLAQGTNALDSWANRPQGAGFAAPEVPMSPQEKMMAEYKAMQEQDRKALEDARSSDRNLKMGGAIGDALATIVNARGQMNVKAPGVQVQQGAGLGKIADMFATAPDVAADLKNKREDLLAQYKQLQTGKDRDLAERRVEAYEADVASRGRAKEGLTPRLKYQMDKDAKKESKLSDKQSTELEGLDNVSGALREVELAKDGVNTGRYASTMQEGIDMLPWAESDQDYVTLKQLSGTQLFDYVKQQTGAAYSVKELAELKNNMPNVGDDDETFKTKLKNVRSIVERKRNEKLKAFKNQGKDISNFEDSPDKETAPQSRVGTIIKSKKDGKRYRIINDNGDLDEVK